MARQKTSFSVALVAFLILAALGSVGAYRSKHRSCAQGTPPLRAAITCLVSNDNSGNLEGLLDCYSTDAVLIPPRGRVVEGKPALKLHYEKIFSTSKLSLSMLALEAVSNGDIGFLRGSIEGKVTTLGDGSTADVNDKFLAVMRCDAGSWKVTNLMWSPVDAAR